MNTEPANENNFDVCKVTCFVETIFLNNVTSSFWLDVLIIVSSVNLM